MTIDALRARSCCAVCIIKHYTRTNVTYNPQHCTGDRDRRYRDSSRDRGDYRRDDRDSGRRNDDRGSGRDRRDRDDRGGGRDRDYDRRR
jgi:hypothetical protein